MNYKIYNNIISKKSSDSLYKFLIKNCKFYSPKIFNDENSFSNKWLDKKFISKMQKFRQSNKKGFAALYDSIQVSNELQRVVFDNNLDSIAKKFLGIKKNELLIRGVQLRMDFPKDTRNSYGWHQDNAYDRYNLKSKNGVVLWIPLIDTDKKNGTLMIKPGSHNSSYNCSRKTSKGTKYKSEQILVMPKYLKKYATKSINVKKNSCLATYCGTFHKSGSNTSSQIRFTIVVRFNNQFSKDFLFYRNLKR